jgi:hypothetical protein
VWAPAFPESNSGDAVSLDAVYRRFEEDGNRYGPRFRCIREMRVSDGAVWGRVELDRQSYSAAEHFRLHPALLDAALQMVIELLRIDGRSELYLPLGIDRMQVNRAVGPEAHCLARNARRNDGILTADIFLNDRDGTAIAALEGCRCRAIENPTRSTAATLAYLETWEPHTPEAATTAASSCTWLLWGFCDADLSALSGLIGADRVRALADAGCVQGNIVCWFRTSPDASIGVIRSAVLALAHLVQRLAGTDYRLRPRQEISSALSQSRSAAIRSTAVSSGRSMIRTDDVRIFTRDAAAERQNSRTGEIHGFVAIVSPAGALGDEVERFEQRLTP